MQRGLVRKSTAIRPPPVACLGPGALPSDLQCNEELAAAKGLLSVLAAMTPQHCQPCRSEDHAKLIHANCDHPDCAYQLAFCYSSFSGPLQAHRCPAHAVSGHGMRYHLQGLPPGVPVSPAFHPAQERYCSCGCRGPVKFTSYCGICGWPEDLCARRVDQLRTSLYDGHNEFTHCVYCPNLARRIIVPATSSPAADWANFLGAGAGIRALLSQSGAENTLTLVTRFMRTRSLRTWQDYLRHFELYLDDYNALTFKAIPGHLELFKLVFHHHVAAVAQQLLYRLPIQFHKNSPRFRESPEYDEDWLPPPAAITDKHQVNMAEVMKEINFLAVYFTNRPAACLEDWTVILNNLLAALTRPMRRVFLLPSQLLTTQPFVDMRLIEQHILDEEPEGEVFASATAASLLKPATIVFSDDLREFLGAQTSHDRTVHLDSEGALPEVMVAVSQPTTPPM